MSHVGSQLTQESQNICNGYKTQVQSGLETMLGALKSELGDEVERVGKSIAECNQELKTLENFQSRCKKLK